MVPVEFACPEDGVDCEEVEPVCEEDERAVIEVGWVDGLVEVAVEGVRVGGAAAATMPPVMGIWV